MSLNVTFRVFRRAYTSRAASALGRVREEANRLAARDARAALDFTYSELERELWNGELAEVELRLKVELTWERPETTLTLQMAQWTRRTKRTGLNENRWSQAEMAALSQERDADVGWREK